jgi:two-component system, sensor histidine kinase and response regulator
LANNGEEAIEQARTQPYHLILLDIHMPVLGGLEAAPRLRALPTNACTPILAVTADTGDEERAAFLAAGMNDCLEKPIAQDALYRMCLQWLSAKRM